MLKERPQLRVTVESLYVRVKSGASRLGRLSKVLGVFESSSLFLLSQEQHGVRDTLSHYLPFNEPRNISDYGSVEFTHRRTSDSAEETVALTNSLVRRLSLNRAAGAASKGASRELDVLGLRPI